MGAVGFFCGGVARGAVKPGEGHLGGRSFGPGGSRSQPATGSSLSPLPRAPGERRHMGIVCVNRLCKQAQADAAALPQPASPLPLPAGNDARLSPQTDRLPSEVWLRGAVAEGTRCPRFKAHVSLGEILFSKGGWKAVGCLDSWHPINRLQEERKGGGRIVKGF